MPRTARPPTYRRHRARNCAVVTIKGRNHYLGPYGSPESHELYARLIAAWQAGMLQDPLPSSTNGDEPVFAINDLILAYWQFAKSHYVKDGKPTDTLAGIRAALRYLRNLFGGTPASEFGPKSLKILRHNLIEAGLSRGVVNKRIGQIKREFKWAAAEELVASSVYHGLQTVAGLTVGRSSARETEPVRPVPDLYVAVVLPFVSPHVAAMIKVQRLSGMRGSELVLMRLCDIDTSGDIWIYEPFEHNGRWRGHRKQIPLGPEAQRVLEPFLNRDPQAFLFSPREAEAWRLEHRPPYHGRERKTKIYPSELRRRQKLKEARRKQRKPKRPKRDRYYTGSYRKAIEYGFKAAKKAGLVVPHWHPHQLRHNRGTEVRKKYGIEAAQVALGHAKANTTEIYAEKNLEQARQIAKEMG